MPPLPPADDSHSITEPAGPLSAADSAPDAALTQRVLEPEVMDTFEAASQYDQMDHAAVNARFVDDLLAAGNVGTDVIDLGTGTALIPIELCNRVDSVRVLAVDASVEMLDLARRRVEIAMLSDRIQLEHDDCKSLKGFQRGMFDLVISNSLFHHLPDPSLALQAAIRVLRPGGRLFIRDLARPATLAEVETLVATHTAAETAAARTLFRDSLLAALSLDEIRQLVAAHGFDRHSVTLTSDRHWTFDATLPPT